MDRRAKIVATIGPSCQDEVTIRNLILSGMNVARLNFSHGNHADHASTVDKIRRISHELSQPITILQDLQGPKIRTGLIKGGQVTIYEGQTLTLTTDISINDPGIIPVDFPQFIESAIPGKQVLIDDGNLELIIESVASDRVETRVVLGGTLKSHKGLNLPGTALNIPGFTDKDRQDLKFGIQIGVDVIAVSFVRCAKDIQQVRHAITHSAPDRPYIPIIAKLERPEALEHLEEIIQVSDGVMVARGDLGVEMAPEAVPVVQKKIIGMANRHSKVVITATQMLDSMINNPRPTRAETSDVANAIFDGTDAVMLSGETASGKYPLQAIDMMHKIICEAESQGSKFNHWDGNMPLRTEYDDTYYITMAARELAHDRNVSSIAVFTQSGRTAQLISKSRPRVPIIAFTTSKRTYQRLNLLWGVFPYLVPHIGTIEEMLIEVEKITSHQSEFRSGDQIVLVCGYPIQSIRPSNLVLLHTLGDKIT